jgi:hypothetical protein
MIRYTVSAAQLDALIDAEAPNWRTKAAALTAANVTAGKLVEKRSTWSEIKPVYMRLQHNKCLYCERPLAGEVAGKIEQDVEHFRPKGKVSLWPKSNSGLSYPFSTGAAAATGYFWLAYDLANYAASCKPCNSTRKSDAFPISAAARGISNQAVKALNTAEKPLLIFPFGDWGDDPSNLLTYDGITIVPKKKTGAAHRRALVTIDFFGLNSREELWEDRFRVIRSLFANVEMRETAAKAERRAAGARAVQEAISDAGPQALLARTFLQLMEDDPDKAWQTYQAAETFIQTHRP